MQNINVIGQPNPEPQDCSGQIVQTNINDCQQSGDATNLLHNSLNGLQGGTVNERYHLTKQQHDAIGTQLSGLMDLSTNQTANGTKTFLLSPQVPDGQQGQDAVNYEQLVARTPTPWYLGPWYSGISMVTGQVVSYIDQLYEAKTTGVLPVPFTPNVQVSGSYTPLSDTLIGYQYFQPTTSSNTVLRLFHLPTTTLASTTVNFSIRTDINSSGYEADYYFVFTNDVHKGLLLNTWYELKPIRQTSATIVHSSTCSMHIDVMYDGVNYVFRSRLIIISPGGNQNPIPMFLEARKSGYNAYYNSYPVAEPGQPASVDNSTIPVLTGTITQVGDNLFDHSGNQFVKSSDSSSSVVSISVVSANGVSGTSSGGATPALTFTLGAITPTSVSTTSLTTSSATGITLNSADPLYTTTVANTNSPTDAFEIKNGGHTVLKTSLQAYPSVDLGNSNTAITNLYGVMNLTGDSYSNSPIARGIYINQNLWPTVNSDTLIGLDINPVFESGNYIATIDTLVGGSGTLMAAISTFQSETLVLEEL